MWRPDGCLRKSSNRLHQDESTRRCCQSQIPWVLSYWHDALQGVGYHSVLQRVALEIDWYCCGRLHNKRMERRSRTSFLPASFRKALSNACEDVSPAKLIGERSSARCSTSTRHFTTSPLSNVQLIAFEFKILNRNCTVGC